ncbi:MAG: amidohydrolase family protein [Streptosporangiaceae bacterium]
MPGMECDLVIRGGTVVTAGSSGLGDIGISNGRIVQLGGEPRGRRELDASGALVLPGGIDMHVHLSQPQPPEPGAPAWADDFHTGSRAAIAGGVTTFGNMTFAWPGQSLREALSRDLDAARDTAAVDYVLHPVLHEPSAAALAELPALAADGHTSLKLFMVSPAFDAGADAAVRAIAAAGRLGMLTLLHCEDSALVQYAGAELIAAGKAQISSYPESRPVLAERVAVDRAAAISEATGAPIYVVHLSSGPALASARRAQAAGVPVYVEVRPLYLYLTSELLRQPDGAKYVGAPPLREAADVTALWAGLADGAVHTVGSDHAPWTLADKLDPALDATTARQGVADLETILPMLFSAGVTTGKISLQRFVSLTATAPARLFGLYPRKGTIAIGSDADLVVLDPELTREIDGRSMQSRAGYSVYDGMKVTGWPRFTISRGEVVLDHGEIAADPGRGQWLRRDRTAAP